MLTRIARFSIRHRRSVIAGWLVLLVAGFVAGDAAFGRLDTEGLQVPADAESETAGRLLGRPDGGGPGPGPVSDRTGPRVVGLYDGVSASDAAFVAGVERVAAQLRPLPGVGRVIDPVSVPSPDLRSIDGRAAVVIVELDLRDGPMAVDGAEHEAVRLLRTVPALTVLVTGDRLVDEEFGDQAEKDLQRAEMLSFPVLLLLLVLLFGGVVAASLPLLTAFVALAGTLLVLFALSLVTDVSVFSINVASMLGLGLAVDYGLLLVSRYREELAVVGEPFAAIERTMATAGRTVVFSGLTVAVCLSALLVYEDAFLRSMAAGGMAVVLIGLSAALTLLPALLAAWHRRIRPSRRVTSADRGFFVRLSRVVQRRAVPIVALVAAGLVFLATPFLRAHYEEPDARFLPTSSDSRRIADIVDTRFAEGSRTEPIEVIAVAAPASTELAAFADRVRALPGVTGVDVTPTTSPGVSRLHVTPEGTTSGATATGVVEAIRALDPPFETAVTGDAAELVDTEAAIVARLPWCLGLLAVATWVLLFLLTGSVVVPLKALVMNLLSLGATFGALVWVFQDGNLAGLLGVDTAGALDIATPLLIFVIAFGLSMDYEVFLLSRIREVYEETGDNDTAVALGLQRTGRIVTSAAALIVVVFLGFMAGGFLSIKQVGLGMALAVVLDATVVRMLLVPATMKLLGDWNWWAPKALRRFSLSHEPRGLCEKPRVAWQNAQTSALEPASRR